MFIENLILRVQRAETPFYAAVKRIRRKVMCFHLPIPRWFDPIYRAIDRLMEIDFELKERLLVACYRYPLLRAKCESVGKGIQIEQVPSITGNLMVYLGDDVRLSGRSSFSGGRVLPEPAELRIGNRSFIGHGCTLSIARSIDIGEDVLIAGGCHLFDYSAHPKDAQKRMEGLQVDAQEVGAIRIGNRAWLGRGVTVLPGVTIGEEAIIGSATVVTKDVPSGHVCVGNPGRVIPLSPTIGSGPDLTARCKFFEQL